MCDYLLELWTDKTFGKIMMFMSLCKFDINPNM